MFVCIFCIYFIEISFLLNDITNYVTISSPGCGAKQRLDMKLCTAHFASLKWIVDADQAGWMLICVFTLRTGDFAGHASCHILSKKSSAQMGFRINPVLARNSCSQCYMSLFTEIILQQFDALKIEIQGTLTKL